MLKHRTHKMSKTAFDLKMEFHQRDDWGLLALLKGFQLFSQGRSRRISNIMQYRDDFLDLQTYIFDYRFVRGRGKHRKSYNQTVFFIQSKKLGLPEFLMKPENFFHKIGNFLGIRDIDFEEYPIFSEQYFLKGEDEDFIRASMNEEILKFFTIEKNWSLEGVNYYMVLYQKRKLIPPQRIRQFYQKGMDIYKMLITDAPRLD